VVPEVEGDAVARLRQPHQPHQRRQVGSHLDALPVHGQHHVVDTAGRLPASIFSTAMSG
jgi:hypothetical protein